MADVHVLGIRHHGPGSARAVRSALDQLLPDAVLIEGPPELDAVAPLAASPRLEPPVAALVYAVDDPQTAGFYPMAVFSPEWVALRWAAAHDRPVRFLDLPATHGLAMRDEERASLRLHQDPLQALAAAAGYDDTERWWEDAIEHRFHGLGVFEAVCDAMAALREAPAGPGDAGPPDLHNDRREAAMRRVLRAAIKEGHGRIAVVCGAWHAPALVTASFPTQAADAALLRGLPAVKVAATWVPWTTSRLARASGYGAGVTAPGWYHHLFTSPDDAVVRWMVKVAGLLRDEQLDVSPASVVEAVRLSEALAALRGRPLAGLAELTESTRAVLGNGSDVPVQLVARKLLVGDILGSVPDETPMVPLARDLARAQKRLRLKPSAAAQMVELDLRTESHRERSKLLHRLRVLDVPWGQPAETGRTRGTFKEAWRLEWFPELEVALVEASTHGTTIESAATAVVVERAATGDIAELAPMVDACLLSDLAEALSAVLAVLDERAARQHDTAVLMAAVEPLARARRYGDVRRTDTAVVHRVLTGVVLRVTAGLSAACASLDDDAAAAMRGHVDAVQRGVALVDDGDLRAAWTGALSAVAHQAGVHGLVAGRIVRLLFDGGHVGRDELARRLAVTLSPAEEAGRAAAWLDGFLAGDAVLLLHEPELLQAVDGWVTAAPGGTFDDLLPLLRRTFARFQPAERRAIGDLVRRRHGAAPAAAGDNGGEPLDHERAARVLPRIVELLGASR